MRINTNLTAMNTYTQYTKNQGKISNAVAKLSSGYAINSAADNAAGLAISEKMRAQIRGLDKASSNAQDAISLVQTAEGALDSSTQILQRMRELAVQSSSDTNQNIDRNALQDEFSQLQNELNDISKNTTFNKKNLLDGTFSATSSSLSNVKLANTSMALSAGSAVAGSYSFAVTTKQESAAVDAKAGTATTAMGSTASSTFSAAAATSPTTKTALYNGDYALTTTVNKDSGTLSITAKGNNGQTFTASVSSADLKSLTDPAAGGAFATTSNDKLNLNFASTTNSTDGFSLKLTLNKAVSTSDNGLDALAKSINNVTVSVDGGVDAKAATYGVYGTMTGGQSVKLYAGDTSVTFSNGASVSFDKLSATDVAVKVGAQNVKGFSSQLTSATYGTTKVDIASAFSGLAGGTDKLELTITDGKLADGSVDLDGSQVSVKSIKSNGATGAAAGQVITLTDGTNDYSANITYDSLEADNTTGKERMLTLTAANGSTLTAKITGSASQAGQTITANATPWAPPAGVTLAKIESTGGVDINETVQKYSYSLAANKNPSTDVSAAFEDTQGTPAVAAGTAALKITGLNIADSTASSLGDISLTSVTDDGTDYKFTLKDATTGTSYTATIASANIESVAENTTTDLTFSDGNGNSISAQFILAGGQKIGGVKSGFASTKVAETTATAKTVDKAQTEVATLSNGLVNKMGASGDTGKTTTTATEFAIDKKDNAGLTFQVGANEGDQMTINIEKMDSENLGVASAKIDTQVAAKSAVTSVDSAINKVSAQRANLGAVQNRLTYKIDNLSTSSSNLTSAESQIRDVDMAKQMTEFTNANILSQAATAMLAQANSLPQGVLKLLG